MVYLVNPFQLQKEFEIVQQAFMDGRINKISKRDKAILYDRYIKSYEHGEWMTMRELGKEYGISTERINQIIKQRLNELGDE